MAAESISEAPGVLDQRLLKKLQNVETEILSVVADFCDEHHIQYSLYAGTALGAVRHKGFIPWDDDIDICMLREDFERFQAEWMSAGVPGYYLEPAGPETDSTINHAKVCKEGTVLASREEYRRPVRHGIWVDIFPLDRCPAERHALRRFLFQAKLRMVLTRNKPYGGNSKTLGWISKAIIGLPMRLKITLRRNAEDVVTGYADYQGKSYLISANSIEGLAATPFPGTMLDVMQDCKFDGRTFKITTQVEEMLTITYGDYMQLPPESERVCKHRPEVLIFGDESDPDGRTHFNLL